MEVNRRSFLKGGVIAAASMPMAGLGAAKETAGSCKAKYETDVLVVGGGPAVDAQRGEALCRGDYGDGQGAALGFVQHGLH